MEGSTVVAELVGDAELVVDAEVVGECVHALSVISVVEASVDELSVINAVEASEDELSWGFIEASEDELSWGFIEASEVVDKVMRLSSPPGLLLRRAWVNWEWQ